MTVSKAFFGRQERSNQPIGWSIVHRERCVWTFIEYRHFALQQAHLTRLQPRQLPNFQHQLRFGEIGILFARLAVHSFSSKGNGSERTENCWPRRNHQRTNLRHSQLPPSGMGKAKQFCTGNPSDFHGTNFIGQCTHPLLHDLPGTFPKRLLSTQT